MVAEDWEIREVLSQSRALRQDRHHHYPSRLQQHSPPWSDLGNIQALIMKSGADHDDIP